MLQTFLGEIKGKIVLLIVRQAQTIHGLVV